MRNPFASPETDLAKVAAELAKVTADLQLLRANDKTRDRQIELQRERIGDLLRANNQLLMQKREVEAAVRELQAELNRRP